jgi:hypothetical protein
MTKRILCSATIVLIAILLATVCHSTALSSPARVDFDGKRISVAAPGISLGKLLSLVEKQTGVHFSLTAAVADTIVYVNFSNSTLTDGIRRILSHANHAMLYDGSGRIRSVIVFDRSSAFNAGSSINLQPSESQPWHDMPENDTSVASYIPEETETPSVESPDQGPEGQRSPPGADVIISPQNTSPDSENKLPPPPVDVDGADNDSAKKDSQLQTRSVNPDADDTKLSENFEKIPQPDESRVPQPDQKGPLGN